MAISYITRTLWILLLINTRQAILAEDVSECDLTEQFRCKSGDLCISSDLVQNGVRDCPDGSDEVCQRGEFACSCGNPSCIPVDLVLDGISDCVDGSDEGLSLPCYQKDDVIQSLTDRKRRKISEDPDDGVIDPSAPSFERAYSTTVVGERSFTPQISSNDDDFGVEDMDDKSISLFTEEMVDESIADTISEESMTVMEIDPAKSEVMTLSTVRAGESLEPALDTTVESSIETEVLNIEVGEDDAAIPIISSFTTTTILGFADFSTTIGSTVVVFSPNAAGPMLGKDAMSSIVMKISSTSKVETSVQPKKQAIEEMLPMEVFADTEIVSSQEPIAFQVFGEKEMTTLSPDVAENEPVVEAETELPIARSVSSKRLMVPVSPSVITALSEERARSLDFDKTGDFVVFAATAENAKDEPADDLDSAETSNEQLSGEEGLPKPALIAHYKPAKVTEQATGENVQDEQVEDNSVSAETSKGQVSSEESFPVSALIADDKIAKVIEEDDQVTDGEVEEALESSDLPTSAPDSSISDFSGLDTPTVSTQYITYTVFKTLFNAETSKVLTQFDTVTNVLSINPSGFTKTVPVQSTTVFDTMQTSTQTFFWSTMVDGKPVVQSSTDIVTSSLSVLSTRVSELLEKNDKVEVLDEGSEAPTAEDLETEQTTEIETFEHSSITITPSPVVLAEHIADHLDEGPKAKVLVTTLTYATTFFRDGMTEVVTSEEVVSNTVIDGHDLIEPSVEYAITYYTTFTYSTTTISDGATYINTREDTVSNVVIPTKVDENTAEASVKVSALPVETTFYTTITYLMTSFLGDDPVVESSFETVTNVVTNIQTPLIETIASSTVLRPELPLEPQIADVASDPFTAEIAASFEDPEDSGARAIKASNVAQEVQKEMKEPVGLISVITRTVVSTGLTTRYATDIIGTYINGLYAEIHESTSEVIKPTTTNEAGRTLVSQNIYSAYDIDGATTTYFTTKIYADGDDRLVEATSTMRVNLALVQSSFDPSKTGLVRMLQGTMTKDNATTLYESRFIGTIIDGSYSQVVESTSSVDGSSTVLAHMQPILATSVFAEPLVEKTTTPSVETSVESSIAENVSGEELGSAEQTTVEAGSVGGLLRGRVTTRLSVQSKARTFTPVIRPIGARVRPTFSVKARNTEPAFSAISESASTIETNARRPFRPAGKVDTPKEEVSTGTKNKLFRPRTSNVEENGDATVAPIIGRPKLTITSRTRAPPPFRRPNTITKQPELEENLDEAADITDNAVEIISTTENPKTTRRSFARTTTPSSVSNDIGLPQRRQFPTRGSQAPKPVTEAVVSDPKPEAAPPRGFRRPQLQKPELPIPSESKRSSDFEGTTPRPRFITPPKLTFTEKLIVPQSEGNFRQRAIALRNRGASSTPTPAFRDFEISKRAKRYAPDLYRPGRATKGRTSRAREIAPSFDYEYEYEYYDDPEPTTKPTPKPAKFPIKPTSPRKTTSTTTVPFKSRLASARSTTKAKDVSSRFRKPAIESTSARSSFRPTSSKSRTTTSRTTGRKVSGSSKKSSNKVRIEPEVVTEKAATVLTVLETPKTITVTHRIPVETAIPFEENGIKTFKTVITATPSLEVLTNFNTVKINGMNRILASEISVTPSVGLTEITQYLVHSSEVLITDFTPTVINGRKSSFRHIVPSTVYEIESTISTINDPLAQTNFLLQQLLLGNLGNQQQQQPHQQQGNPFHALLGLNANQPQFVPATPVTSFSTRVTSYVTTITDVQSKLLPITLRGIVVTTTIVKSSVNVVTATEVVTETIVSTPLQQAQAASNPLANLLPFLLAQQAGAQQPIMQTPIAQLPLITQPQSGIAKVSEIMPEQVDSLSTSVVTLHVAGRNPGEFSTVLHTVLFEGSPSSVNKRQAVFDAHETVPEAVVPLFVETGKGIFVLPDEYKIEDIDVYIISAINNEGTELGPAYKTEPLDFSTVASLSEKVKRQTDSEEVDDLESILNFNFPPIRERELVQKEVAKTKTISKIRDNSFDVSEKRFSVERPTSRRRFSEQLPQGRLVSEPEESEFLSSSVRNSNRGGARRIADEEKTVKDSKSSPNKIVSPEVQRTTTTEKAIIEESSEPNSSEKKDEKLAQSPADDESSEYEYVYEDELDSSPSPSLTVRDTVSASSSEADVPVTTFRNKFQPVVEVDSLTDDSAHEKAAHPKDSVVVVQSKQAEKSPSPSVTLGDVVSASFSEADVPVTTFRNKFQPVIEVDNHIDAKEKAHEGAANLKDSVVVAVQPKQPEKLPISAVVKEFDSDPVLTAKTDKNVEDAVRSVHTGRLEEIETSTTKSLEQTTKQTRGRSRFTTKVDTDKGSVSSTTVAIQNSIVTKDKESTEAATAVTKETRRRKPATLTDTFSSQQISGELRDEVSAEPDRSQGTRENTSGANLSPNVYEPRTYLTIYSYLHTVFDPIAPGPAFSTKVVTLTDVVRGKDNKIPAGFTRTESDVGLYTLKTPTTTSNLGASIDLDGVTTSTQVFSSVLLRYGRGKVRAEAPVRVEVTRTTGRSVQRPVEQDVSLLIQPSFLSSADKTDVEAVVPTERLRSRSRKPVSLSTEEITPKPSVVPSQRGDNRGRGSVRFGLTPEDLKASRKKATNPVVAEDIEGEIENNTPRRGSRLLTPPSDETSTSSSRSSTTQRGRSRFSPARVEENGSVSDDTTVSSAKINVRIESQSRSDGLRRRTTTTETPEEQFDHTSQEEEADVQTVTPVSSVKADVRSRVQSRFEGLRRRTTTTESPEEEFDQASEEEEDVETVIERRPLSSKGLSLFNGKTRGNRVFQGIRGRSTTTEKGVLEEQEYEDVDEEEPIASDEENNVDELLVEDDDENELVEEDVPDDEYEDQISDVDEEAEDLEAIEVQETSREAQDEIKEKEEVESSAAVTASSVAPTETTIKPSRFFQVSKKNPLEKHLSSIRANANRRTLRPNLKIGKQTVTNIEPTTARVALTKSRKAFRASNVVHKSFFITSTVPLHGGKKDVKLTLLTSSLTTLLDVELHLTTDSPELFNPLLRSKTLRKSVKVSEVVSTTSLVQLSTTIIEEGSGDMGIEISTEVIETSFTDFSEIENIPVTETPQLEERLNVITLVETEMRTYTAVVTSVSGDDLVVSTGIEIIPEEVTKTITLGFPAIDVPTARFAGAGPIKLVDGAEALPQSGSRQARISVGTARFNLATKIMRNGVEVIVAGDKRQAPVQLDEGFTPLVPVTLAPTLVLNSQLDNQDEENEIGARKIQGSIAAPSEFITKTQLSTMTHLSTLFENNQLVTSKREEVVTQTITELRTPPIDSAKTYFNTVTELQTAVINGQTVTKTNVVVATEVVPNDLETGLEGSIDTEPAQVNMDGLLDDDGPIIATKTFFTTSTLFTTMFFDGSTVTKSRIEVASTVVTETIGLAAFESLFGQEDSTAVIKPTVLKTFLITQDDGMVKTKTLTRPEVVPPGEESIDPSEVQDIAVTDFVSNSVVPSGEQLNSLKESFVATSTNSVVPSIEQLDSLKESFIASSTESPELEPSEVFDYETASPDLAEYDFFIPGKPLGTRPILGLKPVAAVSVLTSPTIALGFGGEPQEIQAGATVIAVSNAGSVVVVPTDVVTSAPETSSVPSRPGGLSNLLSIPSLSAIGTLGLTAIAQSLAANGGGGLNIQLGPVFDAMSGLLTGGLALAGKRNDTERRVDDILNQEPNFIPVGAIGRPAEARIPLQGVPLVPNAPGSPLLRPGANVEEFRRPITPPGVPVPTPNIIFVRDGPMPLVRQPLDQRPPLFTDSQRPASSHQDIPISPPINLQGQAQPVQSDPRPLLFPQGGPTQRQPVNSAPISVPQLPPAVVPVGNAFDRQDAAEKVSIPVAPLIFKPVDDPRKPIPVPGPGSIVPGPNGPVRLVQVPANGKVPPGAEGTVFIRPVPETPTPIVPFVPVRRDDFIPQPAVIQPSQKLPSPPSMIPFIPSVVTILPSLSGIALPAVQTIASIEGDNKIVRTNIISNGNTIVIEPTDSSRRPTGQVVFPSPGLVFFPSDDVQPTAVVTEASVPADDGLTYDDDETDQLEEMNSNEVQGEVPNFASSEASVPTAAPGDNPADEEDILTVGESVEEINDEVTGDDADETMSEEQSPKTDNENAVVADAVEPVSERQPTKAEDALKTEDIAKTPVMETKPQLDEVHHDMTISHFADEVKNMIGSTMPINQVTTSEESLDHSSESPMKTEHVHSDHDDHNMHDQTESEEVSEHESHQPAAESEEMTEPESPQPAVDEPKLIDNSDTMNTQDEVSVDSSADEEKIEEDIPVPVQTTPDVLPVQPEVSSELPKEIEVISEKPKEHSDHTDDQPDKHEVEDHSDHAIHDVDVFRVDDKDNEISKQDKGQLVVGEKPALQCKLPCKAERHEMCEVVSGEPRCLCRRGYARLDDSTLCEKSVTYKISMVLDKINGSQLRYDSVYEEKAKPQYIKLSNLAKRGIERAFLDSSYATVFRGAELANVKPVDDDQNGLKVDMLVHIKAGDGAMPETIPSALAETVKVAALQADNTVIEPAKSNVVTTEDFDECANEMHDCPSNAKCMNLMGTFTCQCNEGYEDLSSSNDTDAKGRVCAAAVQACTECNFSGACKYDDKQKFLGCECREWYTGETCNINLKVLMIAVIVVGAILLLVISCIVLICCLRSRRAKGAISSRPSFLRYRGPGVPAGTLDRAAIIRGDASSESSGGLDNPGHTGEKSRRSSPPSSTASPASTLQTYRPYGDGVSMLIPRAKHQHVTSYPTQTNLALTPEDLAAREHQLIEYLEKGRGKRARLPSSARSTMERPPQSTFRRGSEGILTNRSSSIDGLSNLSELNSVHGDRISEVRSYDETTVRPAVKSPPYRDAKYEVRSRTSSNTRGGTSSRSQLYKPSQTPDDSSQFDSL